MKSLRQILATVTLTLVIALSISAGEMGAGIVQPPPPPSVTGEMGAGNTATAETTMTGDMGTGAACEFDPITEIALSLLQSVLALF